MDMILKNLDLFAETFFKTYSKLDSGTQEKVDSGLKSYIMNRTIKNLTQNTGNELVETNLEKIEKLVDGYVKEGTNRSLVLSLARLKKNIDKEEFASLFILKELQENGENIVPERSTLEETLFENVFDFKVNKYYKSENFKLDDAEIRISKQISGNKKFNELYIQFPNNNALKNISMDTLLEIQKVMPENTVGFSASTKHVELNWKPHYEGEEPEEVDFHFEGYVKNGKHFLEEVSYRGYGHSFKKDNADIGQLVKLQKDALKREINKASDMLKKYCSKFGNESITPEIKYELNEVLDDEANKLKETILNKTGITNIKSDGITIENRRITITNMDGYTTFKKIMPYINNSK